MTMPGATPTPDTVDFHFDVMCPYAYQTSQWPHLYEIQRPKGRVDLELIATTFQPYLEARDWVSINRGEVVEIPKGDTA